MFDSIYNIFNTPFFVIFWWITATISIILVLLSIIFWALWVAPLLFRLWFWRWFRKIAVVSNNEYFSKIEKDLKDSGIFRKIIPIYNSSISEVNEHDLLVVHYDSFTEDEIKEILSYKKSKAGMIFYYPEFDPATWKQISKEISKLIWTKENTTIVNFRWRLLNDIVTTLITTSYEKR